MKEKLIRMDKLCIEVQVAEAQIEEDKIDLIQEGWIFERVYTFEILNLH